MVQKVPHCFTMFHQEETNPHHSEDCKSSKRYLAIGLGAPNMMSCHRQSAQLHDTKNFVCASVVGLIFLGYIVRKSEKIFRKTTVCAVKLSLPKEVSREIV